METFSWKSPISMLPNLLKNLNKITIFFGKTISTCTLSLEPSLFELQKCLFWANTRPIINESVDLWAAGCILYTMLSGYQPFDSFYVHELIEKIKKTEIDFKSQIWGKISYEAKNLINKLLQKNPQNRLTAINALKDNWFVQQNDCFSKDIKIFNDFRENLENNQWKLIRKSKLNCLLDETNPPANEKFFSHQMDIFQANIKTKDMFSL